MPPFYRAVDATACAKIAAWIPGSHLLLFIEAWQTPVPYRAKRLRRGRHHRPPVGSEADKHHCTGRANYSISIVAQAPLRVQPNLTSLLMFNGLRSRFAQATPTWKLVALLALIGVGTTHCAPMTWNDESRMATIQSLVESRTLVIDHSDFATTGDKVFVAGHFYSDKPPLPAMLGAIAYVPLYALGFRLREGPSLAYFVITLLTVTLVWLCGTVALFYALEFTGLDVERRTLACLALGVGSTFLTWATTFNNHEIAAGCISIGFMFLLKARFETGARNLALAGLFLSIAAASDMPTAIFYVVFSGYVIARKETRRNIVFFLLPMILTAVPTAVADFAIHRSIMPVQIYPQYFQYPGSPWLGSGELSGVGTNDLGFTFTYAVRTLFGPAGFLLYNPLLFLAAYGCVRVIQQRERFWPECLCVLLGSLVLCGYYWTTTTNFAGWSYSIRWFVPILPPLFFFLYPYFRDNRSRRKRLFTIIFAVSTVIASVGALNPWSPLIYSDVPFVANIKQFVEHLRHPGVVYVKPPPNE
jgi:hypothetical protein